MCIALLTTAHPSYALIVIDNRDEFILRPTSRPHWWASKPSTKGTEPNGTNGTNGNHTHTGGHTKDYQEILSSRDLQRAERGTWLGITKDGNIAVLTNFRETDTHDSAHPVHTSRSRGGMVTAWLQAHPHENVHDFVKRMVDEGVGNVGGFSLICGKLRKRRQGDKGKALEPLAIVSNRVDNLDGVPWICEERDKVYGLSNTSYYDPVAWPKVENGKRLVNEAVQKAVKEGLDEDGLIEELFKVLDTDTLPIGPNMGFEDYIPMLKESIFIPPIGDEHHHQAMEKARKNGKKSKARDAPGCVAATEELKGEERPDETTIGFQTGMYGTQRQTVILVDWEGNVTFRERALWDADGDALERPSGDMTFKFKVDGWEDGRGSML